MVVQGTDLGNHNDLAEIRRLDRPWLRSILLERYMGAVFMITMKIAPGNFS